jgi:hypothetical protein
MKVKTASENFLSDFVAVSLPVRVTSHSPAATAVATAAIVSMQLLLNAALHLRNSQPQKKIFNGERLISSSLSSNITRTITIINKPKISKH